MQLQNIPIRRRLMLILLMISVIVMLLMSAAFFTFEYVSFRRSTTQELSTLGEVLASNCTAALAFDNQDDAKDILSSLRAQTHVLAAGLYDRQGRLFARYPDKPESAALPPGPSDLGYTLRGTTLFGFHSVRQGGRRLGTLYIEFDMGSVMEEWIWRSLEIALGVMIVIFFVAYWISRALQRHISDPILALTQTARAVAEQDDYSVRATKSGGGELGLLTDAFNHMLTQIQILNQDLERRVVERTAQLEAANRDLEAFSYSVSHDLRAPLRHIDGFAQLLGKRIDDKLDDTSRRYLATVTGSAKRLGLLIDELLLFCRMGRSQMRYAPVNTRALVDEVLLDLQPETQGRKIEWKIGEFPIVQGDPSMLRQVWANLISNAVKYSQRRETAKIQITYRPNGADEHIFAIQDNGAGFEMAYANELFGVFQRLHNVSEFEGTGIGLANVRRVVERHGGRTWAEGKPDVGATFYFTLPSIVNPGPSSS